MQRTQKSPAVSGTPPTGGGRQNKNKRFVLLSFDFWHSVLSGSFVLSGSLPSRKGGFILLFASLIASVLLTIGIGIGTIVLKELKLSSIGRESQIAFFAADTGIECAIFADKQGAFDRDSTVGTISCAGTAINAGTDDPATPGLDPMVIGPGSETYSHFGIKPISNLDDSCVEVTVEKRDTGATVIIAHGYNTCESDNRRVERALRFRAEPPACTPPQTRQSDGTCQ